MIPDVDKAYIAGLFDGEGSIHMRRGIEKKKKHNKLVKDYDKQKGIHLEKLASKMLKNDEKMNKLKGKNINPDYLNLF